ncbi:hypothetical protein FA95DRAFT_1508208 [Auriscalpium vulgare]|uniref:Uncharacterized protein n=1 Tax=Auriscalpium vulgare TaxID=40419 RepID=A0ACB8SBS7_9AGAM|nr:hypothetical protein FA95DRAFT_1508208 [Auriscalpium vulgare]
MLSGRTKQVLSYGRRGRRIVDVSDRHGVFDTTNENASARSQPVSKALARDPSPFDSPPAKTPLRPRKPRRRISSPLSSPEVSVKRKPRPRAVARLAASPDFKAKSAPVRRQPLAISSPNIPRLSSVSLQGTKAAKKVQRVAGSKGKSLLAPSSPTVDVDIIVLDDAGRRISQEHRVSYTQVQGNSLGSGPSVKPLKDPWDDAIIVSDSEDEVPETPQPAKMRRAARRIITSSVEPTDSADVVEISSCASSAAPSVVFLAHNPAPAHRQLQVEVVIPPSPLVPRRAPLAPIQATSASQLSLPSPPTRPYAVPKPLLQPLPLSKGRASPPPPRTKPRPLTPIKRTSSKSFFPRPPSPPSPTTPTDLDLSYDLSLDLSQLQLSPRQRTEERQPDHLVELLNECGQAGPHEFSAFIETFPWDPLVRGSEAEYDALPDSPPQKIGFQKIGEASYSEVFGIGDVVLKVVPIMNPNFAGCAAPEADGPAPSDAKDVLKEIIVTRAMGELHAGFVRLLRTYVVRGKYPSLLLDLWDEYDQRKGSESVRPDVFGGGQVYAIIVLPNGGPDLEAYSFAGGGGWQKASSVFWQVARALAEAEDLVAFEHRDLHWGQILVRNVPSAARKTRLPMDDPRNGVKATVIDLGLARMAAGDSGARAVQWTPFDDEVFEGEGDYQFDVYRLMREANGGDWEPFQPLTNVMWLHYLADKLLHAKRLRAPPARKVSASARNAYTERECYECIVEIHALLGKSIDAVSKKAGVSANLKGRRKTVLPVKVAEGSVKCAGDIVRAGAGRGWLV